MKSLLFQKDNILHAFSAPVVFILTSHISSVKMIFVFPKLCLLWQCLRRNIFNLFKILVPQSDVNCFPFSIFKINALHAISCCTQMSDSRGRIVGTFSCKAESAGTPLIIYVRKFSHHYHLMHMSINNAVFFLWYEAWVQKETTITQFLHITHFTNSFTLCFQESYWIWLLR
jgi:hypothetical protein